MATARLVSGPQVQAIGLPGDENTPLGEALDELADAAEGAVRGLKDYERDDDHLVEQALMRTLKRSAFRLWERRPIVSATVMRV